MRRLLSILSTAALLCVCTAGTAHAAFGLHEFDVSFTNSEGDTVVKAGTHPFAFTTSLALNEAGGEAEGRVQGLFLDEMPGLLANPTAVPRCSAADFETIDEGVSDCQNGAAVGIFEGATGAANNWHRSPVFNLVAPPGALMRLGFRVADTTNVVIDFELNPAPPYRLMASLEGFPQTIELFAAKLQFWGVPASPEHNEDRGRCAVHGGSCAAFIPQAAYLTLPTSCEGPQATFYEALSWEGDEDFGNALTHDQAEPPNPLGFSSCNKLAFAPEIAAQPTTEAAQSPSGLDLTVSFADEGLASPTGFAQSQVRDMVLALPEGLAINPATSASLVYCTGADLEAETLEAEPDEGCPDASRLGTVEVETPLAEGTLHGSVFAGKPLEGEPNLYLVKPNLYLVIMNHELGVVVKQLVEVERDPRTGQLIAYADDLPQLPFSRLHLHLRQDENGVLITPPRCAAYDGLDGVHEPIWAELAPWSEAATLDLASSFAITSGPDGGPCPTDASEQEQSSSGSGATPTEGNPAATTSSNANPPDTQISRHVLRSDPPIFVFHFQSSEPSSRFVCKLDRTKSAPCRSPTRYRHLSPGRHILKVWAVNAVGKDPTPAIAYFRFPK